MKVCGRLLKHDIIIEIGSDDRNVYQVILLNVREKLFLLGPIQADRIDHIIGKAFYIKMFLKIFH